jgi:dTMP kinase
MIEALKMHINEGNHVICDRYWYSGVAYSTAKGLNYDWCLKPDIGLLEPDLVIFLKGDPEKLSSYSGFG